MFEGIVFGFIVFVACYVMLMRLMGRRADVLHGEFVQTELQNELGRTSNLIAAVQRDVRELGLPVK